MPGDLFAGLRVLELGQYVAIPYCAELFAHGGADVITVEAIEGAPTRHNSMLVPGEGRQYIIKARGKRGIPINLASPAGRDLAERIALSCDIVLTNLRPGLVETLGLDYDSLAAKNPRIVYGEITAFGRHGPDGDKAGVDIVVQAASGMMVSGRGMDDGRPLAIEALLNDYTAGSMLAFGVTAALRQRDITGQGQKVSGSLMQAALAMQTALANVFHVFDTWKTEFVDWLHEEKPPIDEAVQRRRRSMAGEPWFYNTYETRDGALAIAGVGQMRKKLATLLEVDDPMATDPTFVMPDDPRPYMASVVASARARIHQWSRDDLIQLLETNGIPGAPVMFHEEVLLGEQAEANNFVSTFDHPVVGPVTMPTTPVHFSRSRYESGTTSPAYGEHTNDILAELGISAARRAELVEQGIVGLPGGIG